ncbi:alpha/beta hydrolase [Lactobacillus intestinalis]|uniref:alpha/beta hydrolase n=1 Tax=Lactobacillus intestinalis TaxID=151781 RepID=UPI0025B02C73|nr:alpha/beta hydrolase [Lactobacillus intestinalis]
MKKKIWLPLIFPVTLLALIITGCTKGSAKNTNTKHVQNGSSSSIPTFFLHGWGSSVNAERHMVNAARNRGVTNDVVTAIVKRNGQVSLSGKISKNAKNPIIMVGYQDNRNGNYRTDARYAYNAVKAVQRSYNFKKMNLVGHSMGNMDIIFMLLYYGQNKNFPKVNRQVDIAGHFNGIRGMQSTAYAHVNKAGRPSKMDSDYKQLMRLRQTYPKTASVMNIYGDLQDGTHSDKDVTIYSAKSLKYLVSPRAKHYEEHLIIGPGAQHSRLHENPEVDELLIKFLWGK